MYLNFLKLLICQFTYLPYCLSLSTYQSISFFFCLSIYLSIYMSIFLSVYLSVCLSIFLSLFLSTRIYLKWYFHDGILWIFHKNSLSLSLHQSINIPISLSIYSFFPEWFICRFLHIMNPRLYLVEILWWFSSFINLIHNNYF